MCVRAPSSVEEENYYYYFLCQVNNEVFDFWMSCGLQNVVRLTLPSHPAQIQALFFSLFLKCNDFKKGLFHYYFTMTRCVVLLFVIFVTGSDSQREGPVPSSSCILCLLSTQIYLIFSLQNTTNIVNGASLFAKPYLQCSMQKKRVVHKWRLEN